MGVVFSIASPLVAACFYFFCAILLILVNFLAFQGFLLRVQSILLDSCLIWLGLAIVIETDGVGPKTSRQLGIAIVVLFCFNQFLAMIIALIELAIDIVIKIIKLIRYCAKKRKEKKYSKNGDDP